MSLVAAQANGANYTMVFLTADHTSADWGTLRLTAPCSHISPRSASDTLTPSPTMI